jgi:hypothetical protein
MSIEGRPFKVRTIRWLFNVCKALLCVVVEIVKIFQFQIDDAIVT